MTFQFDYDNMFVCSKWFGNILKLFYYCRKTKKKNNKQKKTTVSTDRSQQVWIVNWHQFDVFIHKFEQISACYIMHLIRTKTLFLPGQLNIFSIFWLTYVNDRKTYLNVNFDILNFDNVSAWWCTSALWSHILSLLVSLILNKTVKSLLIWVEVRRKKKKRIAKT